MTEVKIGDIVAFRDATFEGANQEISDLSIVDGFVYCIRDKQTHDGETLYLEEVIAVISDIQLKINPILMVAYE